MPLRRPVGIVALLAMVASLLALLPATAANAVSPNLVISQVYGGGGNAGATFTHDYVELFNRGSAAAPTDGMSVQYASAAGSFNAAVALGSASVPPGGYRLVQLATGGAVGATLPTPDVTGAINASASAGKFVLASGEVALGCGATGTSPAPCTPAQQARIIDLIGYGSAATLFEGPAPAPGGTNTSAVLRAAGGATDTDDNASDFSAGAPNPRNSGGTAQQPPAPAAPRGVKVHEVQGSGAASPLVDQRVTATAIATSVIFTNDVANGFFLQEEDADVDSSSMTSEGVYVFCGTSCPGAVTAGDRLAVTGVVKEFNTSTQIDVTAGGNGVTRLAGAQPLPTAASATLPAAGSTRDAATFESVEGMRTTIPTTLAVSEYFNLARFGEVVLTANERPYQYTQTATPSAAGFSAFQADLATRRITLDDNSNDQNDAINGPDSNEAYYYPTPGLSTGNRLRGGDTISGLTGVFEFSFGAWKLRPVAGASYAFQPTNPRPAAPEAVGGDLRVASFNVLNYFATLDDGVNDVCGPTGSQQECRGADSEAERIRQLDKIVAALEGIDADVVGLIEIQNDDGQATQQVVDALNAATAPGTYDFVRTGPIGTDAIKQAFLFKPATATPVGSFQTLTSGDDPRFVDTSNRPALIQTFQQRSNGEKVTVAVNHFKSKGSGCGAGDDSTADGSGNCDGTRTRAAQALAAHLAEDPTGSGDPDFLIIGDLNSYSQERPISTLEAAGYTDLLERFQGLRSYGYLFDGQLGHLDHALASRSLNAQVTGAGGWKVNADEVPLLDYDDSVDDAGDERDTRGANIERKSSVRRLYAPDAYRSSDHDPVVVGLDLAPVAERPFTLTLLQSNDGESQLLPAAPRGGIARFGTILKRLRAEAEAAGSPTLVISGGDNYLAGPQLQASLEGFSDDGDDSNDGPFYDALALDHLDYDASSVGNHEFDFGPGVFGYFLSQFDDSDIRFVAANLDVSGEQALAAFAQPSPGNEGGALVEWTRRDVGGRSVAIVGVTTPELASVSSPGPDVKADPAVAEAAQEAIDAATADGTDVVVLVSQIQSLNNDRTLVGQLRGVDIAVSGGGSELLANADDARLPGNTPVFGPYPVLASDADGGQQVPIVTTPGLYGYVGRLIVDVSAAGEVTRVDDRSGPVRNVFNASAPPADQATPDPFLLENVEKPVAAFVGDLDEQVVASTQPQLNGTTALVRTRETNLGSLFADALVATAEQDPAFGLTRPVVGLQNSGGIRNSVVLGPNADISRFDTFQIAPFSNFVGYTTGVSPQQLKTLLERSVSAPVVNGALQAEGRFGQWSGLRFVYDPQQPAQTVRRESDGSVTVATPGSRVRQVFLTLGTATTVDDVPVVRNGVVLPGAPSVDVAANSFTVGQNGDDYPFNLEEGQFVNLPVTYQQSLERYLRALSTVTAAQYPEGGLGRIVVGGDVADPTTPPGSTPPSTTPPGDTPPGDTPPGTTPPGTTPPGTTPPAAGVPARTPQATIGARAVDDSCPGGQVPARQFSDVPAGDTHALTVRCVAWFDVAEGFADGTFGPLEDVTRGQMAAFIARTVRATSASLPASPPNRFADDDGTTHERAIDQLAAVGIVGGRTDGTYGADDVVTRAQLTSFLVRTYQYVSGVDLPLPAAPDQYFDDVAGLTQRDDVNRAAAVGLTQGTQGRTFAPQEATARGQMATFLARLLDLFVEDGKATRPTS